MNNIIIRPMFYDDIPHGMRLKTIAGWNQTEDDWKRFLALSPDGCFVAVHDGCVVGTVTTINYGNRISWIGMMLVDPEFRRRGIATRLMARAIKRLDGHGVIKLDATPDGREVYARLGFKVEYEIRRMCAEKIVTDSDLPDDVIQVTETDMVSIKALDSPLFGADRSELLNALFDLKNMGARMSIRQLTLKGYVLGREGTKYYQFGPLVADSPVTAERLVTCSAQSHSDSKRVIDVPFFQTEFIERLKALGFADERQLYRMYLDENSCPGDIERIYAIAGPELG